MQFVVGEQQPKVGYFINNLVYMQCIYVYAFVHAFAALNISYDLLLYMYTCKQLFSLSIKVMHIFLCSCA